MSTRFASPHRNFCLYLESPKRQIVNGEVNHEGGQKCQFVNGTFATDDEKLAARLRKHRACGVTFHEMKAEPAAPDGGNDKNKTGGKQAA